MNSSLSSPAVLSDENRWFDTVMSLGGLLVLSPLLLVIALLVKFTSRGPVFFKQERVGRHGEPFQIYKFRTMHVGAEQQGGQLTLGADPRVTRLGRRLRAWKLDELPQLINVVRGEMALVGPRPEVPRYVALYSPEERRVLAVRPGITDPASLAYRNESELFQAHPEPERLYVEEIMPTKLRLNLEYLEQRTFRSDLMVIFDTLMTLVRGLRK